MTFLLTLLVIVLILLVVGYGLYLINTRAKIDNKIKIILNVFVVVAVIYWLLRLTGLWQQLLNVNL